MTLDDDRQWQARRLEAGELVAVLFALPATRPTSRRPELPKASTFEFGAPSRLPDFGDVPERIEWPSPTKETSGVLLDDAIEDVRICRQLADFCNRLGLPILCVYDPERESRPVPVLLDEEDAQKLVNLRGREPSHALAEASGIRLAATIRVRAYAPNEAVGFFRQGLTDSLALRLATSSSTSTGYDFELSTATSNVSAFWTPAAALLKGRFFGHPTSPVKGKLPAGRFCFGVGTTGGTATYDMTTYFDIPAQSKGYVAL